jgi:hypothetical protein
MQMVLCTPVFVDVIEFPDRKIKRQAFPESDVFVVEDQ